MGLNLNYYNYHSERIFDEHFIDGLSKIARPIVKYLLYKQYTTEEKFLLSNNMYFNRYFSEQFSYK